MVTPNVVTVLTRKFGDVADGYMSDDIMAAAALFLTEVIVDEDIPLNKKMKLVSDIMVSMKKYIRSVENDKIN